VGAGTEVHGRKRGGKGNGIGGRSEGTAASDGLPDSLEVLRYRDAGATTPKVEQSETSHFILRVTDKGTPALTRYKRIVVTVVP
jgi:hypothetical protein